MLIRRLLTEELIEAQVAELRELLSRAFGGEFDETDWDHAIGGTHAVAELDGRIVAHASVVPRSLELDGAPVRGGYVEAVATDPAVGGRGIGSAVMREIDDVIEIDYELGALSTGSHGFYERLGWRRWHGSTWVRTAAGIVRTEEDDDGLMVLPTTRIARPNEAGRIVCEWRPGDVW